MNDLISLRRVVFRQCNAPHTQENVTGMKLQLTHSYLCLNEARKLLVPASCHILQIRILNSIVDENWFLQILFSQQPKLSTDYHRHYCTVSFTQHNLFNPFENTIANTKIENDNATE